MRRIRGSAHTLFVHAECVFCSLTLVIEKAGVSMDTPAFLLLIMV